MGILGTSNSTLANQMQSNQTQNFKTMNNLLTLQENHVEEFFQYHGEAFLTAIEKLMEDVTQRVVSQMLSKLEFTTGSSGKMTINPDAMREFEKVTQENIDLDIQMILNSAINSEVIMQRKMAKNSYLESQGYGADTGQMVGNQGMNPANIQGAGMANQMNNQMYQQQMAMNNGSGYPVPPAGYDQMNNPYWIDPNTGQMTYQAPSSGLGLAKTAGKVAAWAKWLA